MPYSAVFPATVLTQFEKSAAKTILHLACITSAFVEREFKVYNQVLSLAQTCDMGNGQL